MKKFFTLKLSLLVMLLSIGSFLQAQIISENFAFTGALSANGWTAHSAGGTNAINAVAGAGLTYTGLAGSGVGNAAQLGNTGGEDANFPFASQTPADQNIYFSCLVNVTDPAATKSGDYFLHLGNPSGTGISNFAPRLWVRITATGVNFGITKLATSVPAAGWTGDFAKNTTYLLVVRYRLGTAASTDPVSLWVKQTGSLLETDPPSAATTTESTTPSAVSAVALRQGNNGASVQLQVDAIKVGLTWSDVTPSTSSSPSLTATGLINSLTTTSGTPSAAQSFSVSGSNLTGAPGNISISSASSDIEVSANAGGPFASTASIPYTAATLTATNVYARIAASAGVGPVSSLLTISGGGATAVTTTVSGSVVADAPTVQASNIVVSNITDNTMDVNWTNGNGASRIVVIRQTSATAIPPADAVTYTANPAVTGASSTGAGNFVVYNASGTGPVTITGLFTGTNYTINVYEYNGGTGEENYLLSNATNNPATANTTGISALIQQGYFTSVSTPVYAARNTIRIPTVYVATVSGLAPNTTYRYFSQGVLATDFGTTNSGVGSLLLNDYTATPAFTSASLGSFSTAGSYAKFTTNAAGSFTGAFGFFSSGNAKFDAGNQVYPLLVIGDDNDGTSIRFRFALNQAVTMLNFATTNGVNDGSFITGKSGATPNNIVALWKSVDGNTLAAARPLAMTIVENSAATTAIPVPYDEADGSWNTIIPNVLPEGVRLIQQFTPFGVLVGCRPDTDGIWNTTNTVNPATGSGTTTVLAIAAADAPLTDLTACNGVLPVSISSFNVQKSGNNARISWTTDQEINSRAFVIERSSNQRTWTTVTTVNAAGTSAGRINYAVIDNAPASGVNFYRIKMVDTDNSFDYSATKSVLFGNATLVLVTPNPASTFATIYMGKADNSLTQLVVSDMNGKVVENVRTNDQTYTLQTSRYGKGMYVVRVITGANTSTHKLIVQ